jgi:protein SCO1/2
MQDLKTPFLYLSGVGILLLGGLLLLRAAVGPYTFHGSLIDPPVPAPNFSLTDQDGQAFELDDHLGKITLIFFGFTNCPDVCPITLANFTQIHNRFEDDVQLIFITVDPERDTPSRIKDHLVRYSEEIIGLTGTQSELELVWKNYGVFVSVPDHTHGENYEVEHTSRIYAIDALGNWRETFTVDTQWEAIVEDLQQLTY